MSIAHYPGRIVVHAINRKLRYIIIRDQDGDYWRYEQTDQQSEHTINYHGRTWEPARQLTRSDFLTLLGY